MKKILILLVIMILVLCGCGDNQSSGTDKPYEVKKSEKYENQEITNPYELTYSGDIIIKLLDKVEEIEAQRRQNVLKSAENDPNFDYSLVKNYKYDLILLDDDNIPELVVSEPDSWVGLYVYNKGKYVFAMEDSVKELGGWTYGSVDNQSYEYIPKANVVYNTGSEYKNFVNYYNFYTLEELGLKPIYNQKLNVLHFLDDNGNKIPDEGEKYKQDLKVYYYGDKEISEQEFDEYIVEGIYENFFGTKSFEDFKIALNNLD